MTIQNINSTTQPSNHHRNLVQSPDSDFFNTFKIAYNQYQSTSQSTATSTNTNKPITSLSDVMGMTATEMATIRGTSVNDQASYAAILNRAYSEGAMDDPVAFLKTLSPQEQSIVQRAHCLADPINPSTMSKEGAYNLLLPEGYQVDFNNDGMQEVGAAKTITFPPLDAPEEVKQAWLSATQNMNDRDMMTYSLEMHIMLYSIPIDDQPSTPIAPTNQIDSYRDGIDKFLAWTEYTKASTPPEQYQRDMAFFSEMKRLLA